MRRTGTELPLVGRSEVLVAGRAWIEAVAAGSGHVALVAGEPGIGKSRALLELARQAAEADFAVHVGRCLEAEGAPAYWPWVEILRSVWNALPEERRAAWRDRHATALALLPEHPLGRGGGLAPDEEGAAARFRRFDAVARLLREVASEAPTALVLDDLHRMDDSSALLLRHLVGSIADVPVLILGGLRDHEVAAQHPLAALLGELPGPGHRIDLRGLLPGEVSELIMALAGSPPVPAIAEAIATRTGGNPLFVGEIARALARSGDLGNAAAVERAAPQSVRQVIRARVARLAEPAPRVLEVAAVFGREFALDTLCAACSEIAPEQVEAGLGAALRAELVEESLREPGRFRFTHILVRDALYEELPREQRTELHHRAGLALEALRPLALDAHADELAHHFARAAARGEEAKALHYARRAGDRALEAAAHAEAAARFEAALHALDLQLARQGAERDLAAAALERCELLIRLGRALWLGGRTGEAREAHAEAARLARQGGSGELMARAALGFVGRTDATPGVNREGVALLEEALTLLPDADHPLRAEVIARLGTELYYDETDPRRAEALTELALAMAERIGDAALLSYVLSARHYTLMRADVDPRRRLALAEQLIALADATRARDLMALGLEESIVDLLELGEMARLDYALHRFTDLSETMQQPFFRWMCGVYHGLCATLAGDLEQAEALAHGTLEQGMALATPNALPVFAAQLYCVRREQGRLAELEMLLREAIAQRPIFHPLRAGLVALHAQCGRRHEARDAFETMMARDLEDVPRDMHWITVLTTLAPGCAWLGDAERARQLYDLLAPYQGRLVSIAHGAATHGAVDHHLGLLSAACDDPDSADAHFDAALSLHRRVGAPILAAHTRIAWARLLWKGGAPHERARARELAGEATATYQRLGLRHQVEQARTALDEA